MGEVWAAVGEGPGGRPREVAIKVLLARAAMKPDLVRRFEREARIACAINSPYVCQIIEVTQAEDGAHLLVFEHLSGESLADRLKREQYLPFSEVGPIIEDVLRGLSAAHEAGVIHRDLKPGNIFLEQLPADEAPSYAPPSGGFGFGSQQPPARRERAKILDFGISKLTRRGQNEPTLTAFDATLGSFAYMAPEQVRGAARADERADIYAVGAVAFRALSGRLPFEGSTAAVLVAMKLDRSAPSLAEATGEQWPAGVERFLERALERRPEHRFESANEALAVWKSIQPSAVVVTKPNVTDTDYGTRPSPAAAKPAAPRPGPAPASQRAEGLAPARAKTPIPMPTKPVVAAMGLSPAPPPATATTRGQPAPPPLEPEQRASARRGTLTMDDVPIPVLNFPEPADLPTGSQSVANFPIFPTSGAPAGRQPSQGSAPPAQPARSAAIPPAVRTSPGLGPDMRRSPAAPHDPAVPPLPAPRPPMQSYQVIEDNPTEVDGPPEMTFDGSYNPVPAPREEGEPDPQPTGPRSRPRNPRRA